MRLSRPIAVLCLLLPARFLAAADVRGHVRVGGVAEKIDFKDPVSGEESNDERRAFLRLKLDADRFNPTNDLFSLDVRDTYDFFGLLDQQGLDLKPKHKLQIRQLSVKRRVPQDPNFYTLGRFPVEEAGLIAHDGILIGRKLTPRLTVAAFGGMAAKDVMQSSLFDRVETSAHYNPLQAGAYIVYDTPEVTSRESSLYVSHGVAHTPSFDVPDEGSRTTLYQSIVYHLSASQRLSSLVDYDMEPSATLRRLRLSHYYFADSLRVHTSYARVDAVEFQPLKTFRDQLPPSAFDTVDIRPVVRWNDTWSVTGKAQFVRRLDDDYEKEDFAIGTVYTPDRVSATFLAGRRGNFVSDDVYARVMAQYNHAMGEASVTYEQAREVNADGTVLNPKSLMLDAGLYLGERLHGGAGYSILQDERVKVVAVLLTVGYRFGGGRGNQVREHATPFQEAL